MIPYQKINYIRAEINDEHKKIDNLLKDKFKTFKNEIINEHQEFYNSYTNFFMKIIDTNYKKNLNKIIPLVLKIHKDKNKKSNLLDKKYNNLYNKLKSGNFNTLEFLKKVKLIKLQYVEFLESNKQDKNKLLTNLIDKFNKKYPDFQQSNPVLMQGMLNKTLDNITLDKMLGMYKLFYEKKLSNHDASVKFGQHLVDKFIKPNLKKK